MNADNALHVPRPRDGLGESTWNPPAAGQAVSESAADKSRGASKKRNRKLRVLNSIARRRSGGIRAEAYRLTT
jgi:hypothetical protein